jgi:hypothetical protein
MTCPKCDGDIDAALIERWGSGEQTGPLAPYVCGWCASFFVIDLPKQRLLDPDRIMLDTGVDLMAAVKSNAAMMEAITSAQAKIRALPNRRPVLR